VNLANLNVHLNVPVFGRPGRGLPFNFYVAYDSSIWYPVTTSGTTTWTANGTGWGGSEVNVGSVVPTQYYSTSGTCGSIPHLGITSYSEYYWTYIDGFGTRHPFAATSSVTINTCTGSYNTGFTGALAADLSGYSLSVTGITVVSLYSADGNLINTSAGSIEDRNGNKITKSSGVFTDTLGTTALTVAGSGTPASPTTYAYTAPSGASAVYTVHYTNYTLATNFGISTIHEGKSSAAVPLITSIVQADGTQYTFTYEVTPSVPTATACVPYTGTTCTTGRITQVNFPTGGAINYWYTGGNNGVLPDGSTATLNRQVVGDGTWTYSQVKNTGAGTTTTITDPTSAANQTAIQFQGMYETIHQVYQGSEMSGNILRSWTTCYNGNLANCGTTAVALPITKRTVFDTYGTTGPQSEHNYIYNSAGGLSEQDDYDYGPSGPGALLRTTLVTFLGYSNITAFRTQVTVKNGSGTTVSQTSYNYDETTPTATSGVAQHVSVTTSRGNLTSINYSTGLTSHFTYYDTGSPNTLVDFNGAMTTYNYSSLTNDCQMTFPTSITEPLSMSRSTTWNCVGGVPLTTTDENSQVTTYTWNDPYFWRPANVKFPDGGETDLTYTGQTSIKTQTKMNSTPQYITATQLLDGLGRPKESQLNSDPQGVVYQDTTYDAVGRIYTVSNPYRSTSDPTYGLTTSFYDALGRTCLVVPPDGTLPSGNTCPTTKPASTLLATYSGNCATVSDQAGKTRKSCSDALGRLTQVFEDPAGSNFETDYGYDPLGNLLCAGQKGNNTGTFSGCGSIPASWRPRTFVYDAMSRLTSETNPESGTVNYNYNSNGDLSAKVSPAPNQTGIATVTVSYCYDALHRRTAKAYTTSPATPPTCSGTPPNFPSPAAQWLYDTANTNGVTLLNPVGRLSRSNTPVVESLYSYDPVGRVTTHYQTTPQHSSAAFQLNYVYDLAGDLTSFNNGFGVAFSYIYDTVGRPSQLTSTLTGPQYPNPLATVDSSVGYYPFGALRKMTLGNGLTQTSAFNNALQPCRVNVNSSATALGTCTDSIPSGNLQDYNYGFNAGSLDNGSVVTWAATGQISFNRTYGYDSLNRLSSLSSPSDPNGCTGLSWNYDSWGNRTAQTTTGGACPQEPSTTFTNNNRFPSSPYQYDAAGNLVADGTHTYTYDAENRLIQADGTVGQCLTATVCYSYDADGRRVEKALPSGVELDYLYNLAGQVTGEWTTSTPFTGASAEYIYLQQGGPLVAEYTGATTYFIHADHLGSTRLSTGVNQAVVQNLDYLPFGELNSSNSGVTTHMFTGDERDSETGLDQTWFRKYSSNLGSWLTPDPIGRLAVDITTPQSWNRYAYVSNDPCNWQDPLGSEECNFTMNVNNQAGLTSNQVGEVEAQIQAIFGQTDDGSGNNVTVSFVSSTDADSTINLTNASWYNPTTWGKLGRTPCPFFVCENTSDVYVNNVNDFYGVMGTSATDNAIGAVAAHEFSHEMGIYGHSDDPGNLMAASDSGTSDRTAPDRGTYLTEAQMAALF
jgi:RHS repeat-associated protein